MSKRAFADLNTEAEVARRRHATLEATKARERERNKGRFARMEAEYYVTGYFLVFYGILWPIVGYTNAWYVQSGNIVNMWLVGAFFFVCGVIKIWFDYHSN